MCFFLALKPAESVEETKPQTEEQRLTRMTLRSARFNRMSSSSDEAVTKKKVAEKAKGNSDKEVVPKKEGNEEVEEGKKAEQDKEVKQTGELVYVISLHLLMVCGDHV